MFLKNLKGNIGVEAVNSVIIKNSKPTLKNIKLAITGVANQPKLPASIKLKAKAAILRNPKS